MYSLSVPIPDASIDSLMGGYTHMISVFRQGFFTVIWWETGCGGLPVHGGGRVSLPMSLIQIWERIGKTLLKNRFFSVLSLLLQYPRQLWPLLPSLPFVGQYWLPIIIHAQQDSSELLKWPYIYQGLSVFHKYCLWSFPFQFRIKSLDIPHRPLVAHFCAGLASVQGGPWD